MLLFSVLYGFWVANLAAFNGVALRELAAQFLAAEKQGATALRMIGHRIAGTAFLYTGDIVEGRSHFDHALALYDPVEHRPLATRFGQDVAVATLSQRSIALWLLSYPEAALADVDHALKDAGDIGQTATLMYALGYSLFTHIFCRNYAAANAEVDELLALADEKSPLAWKPFGMMHQGSLLALTGQASNAAQIMISGISAWRPTGATLSLPWWLCNLATAYAELGQFDDAWRCIGEVMTAMETTKERIWEAEANRMAGEIAIFGRDLAPPRDSPPSASMIGL